jgi:NAD+ synthase (glutamine-hydrolysing)
MVRYGAPPQKVIFLAKQAFGEKYSEGEIKKWLKLFYKRFFSQQFKRSCMPDGPKVGTICLSPRGDWRMPSDASVNAWIEQLEK